MNNHSLLLGVTPLIVFVLVDTFSTLKTGLIWAVIFAFIETVYSFYAFGMLDWITGISFLLVGLMSYFAWKKDDEKIFMWQPVIISWVFAAYILIVKLTGSDIFLEMVTKYKELIPVDLQPRFEQPLMIRALQILSWTSTVAFALHGAATLFAAYKLNKWWWLIARGIGFYVFMGAAVFLAQYMAVIELGGL
jgi:hypothetical protein